MRWALFYERDKARWLPYIFRLSYTAGTCPVREAFLFLLKGIAKPKVKGYGSSLLSTTEAVCERTEKTPLSRSDEHEATDSSWTWRETKRSMSR